MAANPDSAHTSEAFTHMIRYSGIRCRFTWNSEHTVAVRICNDECVDL